MRHVGIPKKNGWRRSSNRDAAEAPQEGGRKEKLSTKPLTGASKEKLQGAEYV